MLGRPGGELALLLLASLFAVFALVIAVSAGPAMTSAAWQTAFILVLSVAAGGTVLRHGDGGCGRAARRPPRTRAGRRDG